MQHKAEGSVSSSSASKNLSKALLGSLFLRWKALAKHFSSKNLLKTTLRYKNNSALGRKQDFTMLNTQQTIINLDRAAKVIASPACNRPYPRYVEANVKSQLRDQPSKHALTCSGVSRGHAGSRGWELEQLQSRVTPSLHSEAQTESQKKKKKSCFRTSSSKEEERGFGC